MPGRNRGASSTLRSGAPSSASSQSVETSESTPVSTPRSAEGEGKGRRLEDAGKGAAIDQQALAGDVAGLGRTEEGAGGAEFRRIAEPFRRQRLAPRDPGRFVPSGPGTG